MQCEVKSPPDYQKLLAESLAAVRSLRARIHDLEAEKHEPVAVIGMGCRFPGNVHSPEDFWKLLVTGKDAITEIPGDRWNKDYYYDSNPDAPGKTYTREGGFLGPKDLFDPHFFKISPREADFIDPQQRVLLEVAWEAMEDAGIPAERLYGSSTGVFVGVSVFDYANLIAKYMPEAEIDHAAGTGNALSAASGRLSYVFGLKGPSISLDTACSSSLVAVHTACESLRRRECNAALAGGVNMMLSPFNHVIFSRARMLSKDGRCKTFDESANGYVRSEGAGLILLKRLSDALADRDNVRAVIRGGAVNQDGASGGLTVPNGPSQCQVITKALENARVEPAEVDYVEAHGTGTALGDPIEAHALGQVFTSSRDGHPLYVGSVKTNLGHMEAAAGIGGLMKVVLQLQKGVITPHLHLKTPSSRIAWDKLRFTIPAETKNWPEAGRKKRVAGVSSFGFTGTNAHLVLEEGPVAKHDGSAEKERSAHLLTLTAVTADALKQMVGSYSAYLIQHPDLPIGDVCFTANTGRSTFDQRLAVTASSTEELAQKLKAVSDGHLPAGACRNDPVPGKHGALKLAFLYSDESTVYPGMGRELYESQPVFRETLNRCDSVMREEAGWSPLELLYGSPSAKRTGAYAHPVLYSMQYALSLLWKSWGVEPAAVMGYGLGEYAAAVCAGALRFEDGLKLVIRRARWIQSLPPGGGMSAVRQSEQRVREIIAPFGPEISIAAVNGPRHVVIAGKLERLRQAAVMLDKAGIRSKELDVPYALHSSEVAPILRQLAEEHSKIPFAKPQLDFVSGKTADVVRDAITPQYWMDEISSPVRFRDGMETLYRMGCTGFMEIGTRPMLVDMGRQCIQTDAHWFSTMRPGRTDWGELLRAAAELYAQGASINLSALDHGYVRRKVNLPTYPFQRQRHWFTSKAIQKKAPASERPGA